MKVEDDDPYTEKLVCSMCPYTKRNMAEFKEHMIKEHKKDEWNWTLDLKAVQFCDECEIEFPEKTMLRKHLQSGHKEVSHIIVEDNAQQIKPDAKFLTQNTKDLREMLRALPADTLNTGVDEFERDFNDILNERVTEPILLEKTHCLKCPKCNFKASSNKVLNIHHAFVHDNSFHTCDICGARTKTVGGMKQHKSNVHKTTATFNPITADSIKVELSEADSSEYEDDLSDSENDDLPELYREHEWDGGFNYKSRAPAFAKAASALKIMLKKGVNVTTIDQIKVKVVNVVKHDGGENADIEITDEEGSGHVQLQTWKPNKKKRMVTIQVAKSGQGDIKHVNILAKQVVKPLLDKLLNGASIKELSRSFFQVCEDTVNDPLKCHVCTRSFKTERAKKSHFTRMHKTKYEPFTDTEATGLQGDKTLLKCDKCNFKTVNKSKLMKHKRTIHGSVSSSSSPARKKPKLAKNVSIAILNEILDKMYDKSDSGEETITELRQMEFASFEENRVDQQIMDTISKKKD